MIFRYIALIVIILGINLSARAGERLRVATEGAFSPFNYVDEQGQPAGFDVDIAKALCEVLKTECEVIIVPWEQLLPRLGAGDFDMIVASMAETPERLRLAEFTDAYYQSPQAFIGRPNSGISQVTPATVRGKVLATQRGTIYSDYLNKHYRDSAVIKLTDTLSAALEALVKGEADLVLADVLISLPYIRTTIEQPLEIVGEPIPDNELSAHCHIQVRKGNLKLRDELNRALREIKDNGAYSRISGKYFPFDIR